jgi:CRP-like cAMP-binding protein
MSGEAGEGPSRTAEGDNPPNPPPVRAVKFRPAIAPQLHSLIRKLQRNYRFFSDMTEDEISDFLRMCKQETYEEGKKIFSAGESASHFYLLVSGEISIIINEKEVARLEPGEVFGEMALVEKIPRTATAVAAGHSVLFFIPVKVLSQRLPALAYKVLLSVAEQMSARLRNANELITIPKREAQGEENPETDSQDSD